MDATPIYAIMPAGAFASGTYKRLLTIYKEQLDGEVELVSVPGVIAGSARLQSGQVVPVIVPARHDLHSWQTSDVINANLGDSPSPAHAEAMRNFLHRVYYDLRNLGVTGQDRALNYSATNAYQSARITESATVGIATVGAFELDTITVKKSHVCRPDSDCYDVEIGFFSPQNTNASNKVFLFTVDVSDIIPVTIGKVREWSKRP
jgi:cyanobactin maturation PatA/PatG family protease